MWKGRLRSNTTAYAFVSCEAELMNGDVLPESNESHSRAANLNPFETFYKILRELQFFFPTTSIPKGGSLCEIYDSSNNYESSLNW